MRVIPDIGKIHDSKIMVLLSMYFFSDVKLIVIKFYTKFKSE